MKVKIMIDAAADTTRVDAARMNGSGSKMVNTVKRGMQLTAVADLVMFFICPYLSPHSELPLSGLIIPVEYLLYKIGVTPVQHVDHEFLVGARDYERRQNRAFLVQPAYKRHACHPRVLIGVQN